MTGTSDHEAPVSLKTWIAVGGALLGAFLAVLNIQITNTALPYIEGGISTGGVYGTWISTAYLIGECSSTQYCFWSSRCSAAMRTASAR